MHITEDLVARELNALNLNKGAGPDELPPTFFYNCRDSLVIPLTRIFSISISSGKFPDLWKSARVVPIFKSGNKQDIENYRPISIISVLSKIFENIVSSFISDSFRNVISVSQHGFCSGRSTESNLFVYINDIFNAIEDGSEIHCIYTDFHKAFDSVDHTILIHKLLLYGVRDPLLSWIQSYISHRLHFVQLMKFKSSTYESTSGVPQGSVIGPLLFNIFINDICLNFNSNSLLYADDLKLYKKIDSMYDINTLTNDLICLNDWCKLNHMSLNIKKCKAMCFSRKSRPSVPLYLLENTPLDIVSNAKDLGIYLDTKLSFVSHCEYVVSRGRKLLGCLKRWTVNFSNIRTILILYYSLVRSILEFNCVNWSPFYITHISRIEAVQVKLLKYVKYKLCGDGIVLADTDLVASYLSVHTLENRRKYHKLCFLFKLLNGLIEAPILLALVGLNVSIRKVRTPRLFFIPVHKTNYALHSPLNSVLMIANECNTLEFFGISLNAFKKECRKLLLLC